MRLTTLLLVGWGSAVSAQLLDLQPNQTQLATDLNQDQRVEMRLVRLRIPDTPTAIQKAELRDSQGRDIKFRMLADPDAGIIIGTHRDDLTLELIGRTMAQDQSKFILVGRQGERLSRLRVDDLMVTDLAYGQHCIDLAPVAEGSLPLYIQIAMDVSGSMNAVRRDIAASLLSFLELVPANAQCQIQLFDNRRYFVPAPPASGASLAFGSNPFAPAACQAFIDERVTEAINTVGGGSTDIVSALTPFYQEMLQRRDASNLLLVISDGAGGADRSSDAFMALQSLRDTAVDTANAYTIVKWLGGYSTDYPLSGLADHSLAGVSPAQSFDRSIFAKATNLIDHQVVLTANPCG